MREIKFRAWNITEKQMTHPEDLFWFEEEGIRHVPGDAYSWQIMQFTGLKDKNGTDIYEGDIVEYLDSTMHITWSEQLARPVLRPYTIEHHYDLNATVAEECKIIGNIYEHPELLPKED